MKKVCFVTGSRSEYGIVRRLLRKLDDESTVDLDIIVTGTHLEEKYGKTVSQIEDDGFNIASKIPLNLENTSKLTVSKTLSTLTDGLTDIFENNRYDLIIVLGDRYEMLPVANVALIYNIPVCHIHGGEKTLGNFDESIRHAITKMSHLHLASSEEYKNRILQMGEDPKRVFNVGSMGVENALRQDFLSKEELEKSLGVKLNDEYFVVLFHPETLKENSALSQTKSLIDALKIDSRQSIFIGSNSDTESDDIRKIMNEYIEKVPSSKIFASLPTRFYHSLVKHSCGLVGNSSSGLIEVPSLKVPTLNIGDRQLGRASGQSVIHVKADTGDILRGISELPKVESFDNPYEQPDSADKSFKAIMNFLEEDTGVVKDFCDKEFR